MERSIGWLGREAMSDDEKRHALSHELGVPFVKLDPFTVSFEALSVIPEPVAREHNVVAYAVGDSGIEVALLDMAALEHLEFLRNRHRVLPRLTTRESMVRALLRYQQYLRERYGGMLERADSPNMLETLLRHALAMQATDIHIQSDAGSVIVRYRIRGLMRSAMVLPRATGERVLGMLRALAKLPQGTLPREARVRVELDEPVLVRVATVPTVDGEKISLHLVREGARRGWTLESLGFHGEALERVHQALLKRRGFVAVTGGAHSGKTTLLYTMLDMLNTPELAIATVEAEVGHALARVTQTTVSPALTAAAATRAALRTDVDVLMVDPLGDRETASLLQSAAARGTLVLAATTDEALVERPTLTIRTALVRKLCDKHFLDKKKLTRSEQDALEARGADFAKVLAALKEEGKVAKDTAWKDLQFARAAGCSECEHGYKGLLGVQEVVDSEVEALNLVEDALFKAAEGRTTVEEVLKLA